MSEVSFRAVVAPLFVTIGGQSYELQLCRGSIELFGKKVNGLCDADRCWVGGSDDLPPRGRWKTLLHELGHAMEFELVLDEGQALSGEALANWVALGFSPFSVRDFGRMKIYIEQGILAEDVMMIGGMCLPVLRSMDQLPPRCAPCWRSNFTTSR